MKISALRQHDERLALANWVHAALWAPIETGDDAPIELHVTALGWELRCDGVVPFRFRPLEELAP